MEQSCVNDGKLDRFLQRLSRGVLPAITGNVSSASNYSQVGDLLTREHENPLVLILGGRTLGSGLNRLLQDPRIEFVETDIAPGPRTQLICDGQDVPFADGSFDAVIIQGVLSLMVDPWKCVSEIHRVLTASGLVYAESAFIQQVVAKVDLYRFTLVGHRRLFRHFSEIGSGVVCGPAVALAWSLFYFWMSFAKTRRARGGVRLLAKLTLSWLKYLDSFLIRNQAAFDAASSYYFLGRKSNTAFPDRDLASVYRGAIR